MSNMGQSTCIDLGVGQQRRDILLLSDANSTIGKFLQASTHAKMHVQVHLASTALDKKNPFILVMNCKLNPSRVETVVSAVLLTFSRNSCETFVNSSVFPAALLKLFEITSSAAPYDPKWFLLFFIKLNKYIYIP